MILNELLIVICRAGSLIVVLIKIIRERRAVSPDSAGFYYYIQRDFPQGKDLEDCRKP